MSDRYNELRKIVGGVPSGTLRRWLRTGFAQTPEGEAAMRDELAARGETEAPLGGPEGLGYPCETR